MLCRLDFRENFCVDGICYQFALYGFRKILQEVYIGELYGFIN